MSEDESIGTPTRQRSGGLWRWSLFMVCWCLFLLLAGANVTSNNAALSVPDWPLAYGGLNPPRWLEIATIRAELGHRYIAALMGVWTIVLVVWAWLREPRRWVRRLTFAALGLVIVQGVVGGVGVLVMAPAWMSVPHALMAQIYFCLVVVIATALSPWWERARQRELSIEALSVMRLSILGTALLVVQLVLGALARHDALPREVHAMFALVVVMVLVKLSLSVLGDLPRDALPLRRPGVIIAALTIAQVALGLLTYMVVSAHDPLHPRTFGDAAVMNSHLVAGAALLGTTVVLGVRTFRVFGAPTDERVAAMSATEPPAASADAAGPPRDALETGA